MHKTDDEIESMLAAAVKRLKSMTPEEIFETSIKAGIHNADGTLTKEYIDSDLDPVETVSSPCVFCCGTVIQKVTHEWRGEPIYGPGSVNQMVTCHKGWYCKECGLKYEFPPKKKEK